MYVAAILDHTMMQLILYMPYLYTHFVSFITYMYVPLCSAHAALCYLQCWLNAITVGIILMCMHAHTDQYVR